MKTEITPEEIIELSDETCERIKGLIALGYNFDPVIKEFCDWASLPKNIHKLEGGLLNYCQFAVMLPLEPCKNALTQLQSRMKLVSEIHRTAKVYTPEIR